MLIFKTKVFLAIELAALVLFVAGFFQKEEGVELYLGAGLFFVLYFILFVFYRLVSKWNV